MSGFITSIAFVGLMFVIVAVAMEARRRLRGTSTPQARGRNVCQRCGYDLRESPSFCPECGGPAPVHLVLREALRRGEPPAWLTDEGPPLDQRQAMDGTVWEVFGFVPQNDEGDLRILLRRGGMPWREEVVPADNLVRLSVPKSEVELATELLRYHQSHKYAARRRAKAR